MVRHEKPTMKNKNGSQGVERGFMRKTSEVPNERWGMKALVSKIKKKRGSKLDNVLVIGIDFGTTYSGAAWATIADFESDQINIITSWPGTGREEGKAPTELFYENGKVMWGYGIPADADPVRWFKLLLLREEDLSEELRQTESVIRARKMLRTTGKSATDLIADYLRALWQHILETIHKARTSSAIAAYIFQVVITVPAIWKDYARNGMEEAANKAGILENRLAGPTALTFAPEPEAAALATLCEREREVEVDDVYLICDAGGGTVDLITYRVGDVEPIQLHEAVVGTGGLCGGIFVDEAFELMCRERLGRQWSNLSQTGIRDIMKNEWEYAIKPQYKPSKEYNENDLMVPIPAEAFKGSDLNDESRKPIIKNGRIHFESSDIQKAFASVLSDIERLIDEQVKKSKKKKLLIKRIVLVGGFGSSPYLYEHLQSRYKRDQIDIIQSSGMRPRTAICRGAIFKGFLDGAAAGGISSTPLTVVSTIARQSLGVTYCPIFDATIHSTTDRYRDELEGTWRASNQMMWYLKKGEDVIKAKPVSHNFYCSYGLDDEDKFDETITEVILQCDDDTPPSKRTRNVKELCKVHVNREDTSFNSLEEFVGKNGRTLKRWDFDLKMVPSGASTEFVFSHQGEVLASGEADIDFM
ncbi:hypothetical protein VE03_04430 [Pseudogymnoascus sp. 23342-1-I1]|nr:hypothetical protein VE03_04430 [Pseudogymnoascus sp. 23342-1-I1]